MRETHPARAGVVAMPLERNDRPSGEPIETLPPGEVYGAVESRRSGLTAAEAERRLQRFGPNEIAREERVPLLRRLLSHFTHVMAVLLWVGGGVALAAGLPTLAIAIWLVNAVNGVFSFWQEYRAEKATEALRRLLPPQTDVLRNGEEVRVTADRLVPGDVMLLEEGDLISADARLVEDVGLRVNQSTLTGEAAPVRKVSEAGSPMGNRADVVDLVFAGTTVAGGKGKAVVIATGMQTELGKISHLTQETTDDLSPLQRELGRLSMVVSVVAVGTGVAFFAVATALGAMDLARGFVFALGMIVAFVPEGLLPTVTLALAMGTQRMARRHALVKRLSSVETLGSTTVICTDKTGTLTQNEMTVREIATAEHAFTVTGVGYDRQGAVLGRNGGVVTDDPVLTELLVTAGLDCNARVTTDDEGRRRVRGDPTEGALVVACEKAGVDLAGAEAATPRVTELPFDPVRKRMSTVNRGPSGPLVLVKGAPRELLALCTRVRLTDGTAPLDDATRRHVLAVNDDMGRRGLRVLGVARATPPEVPRNPVPGDIERDLTFLGLAAMMDPPRPEVEAAVATCRKAGIRIVMMTGDYGLTAESIARRVGMVGSDRVRIVNGDELRDLDDSALEEILRGEVIFARTAPEQKLRVVTALQAMGEVVAVTGDGVNDAPALKRADIGVAMGMAGTDVAREAADMVLLDDNFASIVSAVEEGRAVFANIKRFTSYIFTSNTPEAVPFVLFALTAGRIPLALDVMAILSIDLGTDLVPALALGAEPPEPGVMDRPPRPRREHIVSRSMLAKDYFFLGPLQTAAVLAGFFGVYWAAGYSGRFLDLPSTGPLYRAAVAMALAAVVATQIGNLFAHRALTVSITEVGFFTNRMVWVGIASELAILTAIVYLPALQDVIGTAPFAAGHWLWLLPMAPLLLVADEARKWVVRTWRRTGGRSNRTRSREWTS